MEKEDSAAMGPLLGHEQKPRVTLVSGAHKKCSSRVVLPTQPPLTTPVPWARETEKGLCCKGQRMPTGQGALRCFVCTGCHGSQRCTALFLAIKLVNVLAKERDLSRFAW